MANYNNHQKFERLVYDTLLKFLDLFLHAAEYTAIQSRYRLPIKAHRR